MLAEQREETKRDQVEFCHLSLQEHLAAEFVAEVFAEDLAEWLRICAGSPWWSQVLIRVADLLPDTHVFLRALSEDPRAQLRVGQRAELTYGQNVFKAGRTRRVTVLRIDGEQVSVLVEGGCWQQKLTVPRGVVYVRAEGAGVLLLAAATVGAGAGAS